jgi:hypothetical protein
MKKLLAHIWYLICECWHLCTCNEAQEEEIAERFGFYG